MKRIVLLMVLVSAPVRFAFADEQKAADALIARALELRREGRALPAVELLQKANMIAPTPRSVGQLGLAESAVEHWSDAEEYTTAALESPQDPWVRRNRPALDQALALARAHIGQVLLTGPSGATIVISGKSAGGLPLSKPVRVAAGPALVIATAPGFKPFEMSVPVEAGKETRLEVVLEPLQLAVPSPSVTQPATTMRLDSATRPAWRSWAGVSLVTVGGAATAWGVVWLALDGHTAGGSCSVGAPPGCVPVYNTRTTGIILTGAGLATAAAGGILLYTGERHTSEIALAAGRSSLLVAGRF